MNIQFIHGSIVSIHSARLFTLMRRYPYPVLTFSHPDPAFHFDAKNYEKTDPHTGIIIVPSFF
jgi:hypothetical protein